MSSILLGSLRAVRANALAAADALGINKRLGASQWRRGRLLILCYHGVSIDDEHEWSDLYVSPGHLERRLALLRKSGATVLPLDEALRRLAVGDLPPSAVALTFDDGAHDFSSKAMPILSAFDAHATLYLTTYYCGRNQPVFDTVASYLLWKARGRSITLPGVNGTVQIPGATSEPEFADIHNQVRRYALEHEFDADEKNEFARTLAETVHQDFDAILERKLFQIMSPEEVTALDRRLISVQLHTHRHRTPRDDVAFEREIDDNRQAILSMRGEAHRLNHFCYPSGDYVKEYADWLRQQGVEWATTCDPGLASDDSDPFFLPRFIDAEPISEATFRAWVSGLSLFAFARRRTTPVRLAP